MSKEETNGILITGIGNSGRKDDGLGWLMLDFIKEHFPALEICYRYQLQIEDAEMISTYRTVIFIDATKEETSDGFYLKVCQPNQGFGLTSHLLSPETVLYLEHSLYGKKPLTYILGIQGYQWGLSQEPSQKALTNLKKAQEFLLQNLDLLLQNTYQPGKKYSNMM